MAEATLGDVESLSSDGGLEKTVLRAGEGGAAGRGARVSLRYSMRLASATENDVFDSSEKRRGGVLQFTVGRGRVIPAMERIAESMALNEECEVTCSPVYTFGSVGLKRKKVPPNATIVIRAEMVTLDGGAEPEKPFTEMSATERFARAEHFKEIGNRLFKEHKFEKAVAEYTKTIRCIASVFHQPMQRPRDTTADAQAPAPKSATEKAVAPTPLTSPEADAPAPIPSSEADGAPAQETNVEHSAALTSEPTTNEADVASPSGEQVPSTDVRKAHAVPVVLENGSINTATTKMAILDDSGFQEAEVVIDATGDTPIIQTPSTSVQPSTTEEEHKTAADATAEPRDGADGDKQDENDVPTEEQVLELHVRTLNNLSLCCIKLGEHKSAEEGASLAIRMDDKNFKAFYYRGRARVAQGKLEEARSDLIIAAKLKPQNMGIRTELDSVQKKLKQQEAKERKQAAAMFA